SMPNEKVGLATGLYKMSGTLGGAFGIALSTTVFSMLQLNYAPMNGRLRNTEKSIKGTSCRRSMMMNISVVMIKMLRQMNENV
ncbi:hypothetical protein INP07_14345, partial [Staphylococcus aureus]|nr:hypothetical protein [Staphylococcus aureus]MBO8497844.1 hypothetical protein [Staphylococcus aureus]